MKKIFFAFAGVFALMVLSSCSSTRLFVPQATNMAKAVSFEELNLTGKDYEIIDRIEASARIEVTMTNSSCTIKDTEGSFSLNFTKDKNGEMILKSFEGVVRAGYLLSREQGYSDINSPNEIAFRMAMYRIINLVREQGGDGIIEPVISTNVEKSSSLFGKTTCTLLTTVSGKVVRLKNTK